MSWCGGGEISATPGVVWRRRAISTETLWPGSWPPSPGFEPCAILIWSSSANAAYSGVALGAEAGRILSPLAAVRPRPQPVERRRDRLVRLRGQRAVRHAAGGETQNDRFRRLHLVERHRVGGREVEQVAQLHRRPAVDEGGEAVVRLPTVLPDGEPQSMCRVYHGCVGLVRLAALPELDVARVLQPRGGEPGLGLALELVEPEAADRRRRAGEAEVDHLLRETEHVEHLRAAVGGDVGDPHLRHDLQHPVFDRRAEALLRGGRRGTVAADLVRRGERGDGVEREPWADRLRPVAEQAGEVVRLADLVGLDDDRRQGAQPACDQVVVHGPDCEQRRDRRPVAVGVRHQQRRAARPDERLRLLGQATASAFDIRLERRVEPVQAVVEDVGVQEEALELRPASGLGPLRQQRSTAAEDAAKGERVPFAQVVDRRVGHLCEALTKVRVDGTSAAREQRERRVVAQVGGAAQEVEVHGASRRRTSRRSTRPLQAGPLRRALRVR